MKLYHITETVTPKGHLFKATGFLGGKSYRGLPVRTTPNSDVLRIMTRSPNARHPGEWPRNGSEGAVQTIQAMQDYYRAKIVPSMTD